MKGSQGNDLGDFSMLELFRTELETQAAVLNEGLMALEKAPQAVENIEPLMRAAHSIKGAARIVELEGAVKLAHALEDFFVAVQQGKCSLEPDRIDILLKGVDVFSEMSRADEAEMESWLDRRDQEIEKLAAEISSLPNLGPEAREAAGGQKPAGLDRTAAAGVNARPVPGKEAMDLGDLSLLDLFRTEVGTQAAVLSDGLLDLEKSPGAMEKIEPLMRAAHSIKGAARIVQLDPAVKLAHTMEDCFVAAQQGKLLLDTEQIDILLKGVDLFFELSRTAENTIQSWLDGQIVRIEKLISDISSSPVARPTAGEKVLPETGQEKTPAAGESRVTAGPDVPGAPEKPDLERDNVVRVTAENLNQLMGLAGESLVDVRWFRPFSKSLLYLKNRSIEIDDVLASLSESLGSKDLDPRSENHLNEAREKMSHCVQTITDRISEFESFARRSANLSNRLHREVLKSRMRPFADGVQGFPRMVRDLARKLGKKVGFETIGKLTPVDRDILDKLEAPLNHLIRNSLDHGIESPQDRKAAGKPEEGNIRLEAIHKAGMLVITVSDDGRGIDYEKLRAKVSERNLSDRGMAAKLTESELIEFLFLPGFSTADKVTEISGRGVGLDVVRSMVHEVGGIIRANSKPGKSLSFQLQLPCTLSVIRTLLVSISGEPYAFPLSRIDRCLNVPRDNVELVEGRQYISFDNRNIGLVGACQILELESSIPPKDRLSVVVLSEQGNRYGVLVDRFLGECNLVVQPIDPRLKKIKDISAAAIMVNGAPILIIDIEDMVRSIENILSGDRLRKAGQFEGKAGAGKRKHILVVDDSITVREIERRLLENKGYIVDVAVNGMDGWNALRSGSYDLVVSDIDMPRMNGIELTGLIKKDHQFKSLPVMIVSYKDREEDKIKGLEAGANYYLTKSSFHDETFLNAVIDLIGNA
ncbi:MAG TPA: hybrid sensor histidine kinase/response regulator [archaeon]|nr:hybrid sensor histidine kinase/response regulator [archaeon]